MKEHPILFSTEMIKAILRSENPKTHTRRICDLKKFGVSDETPYKFYLPPTWEEVSEQTIIEKCSPYKPGNHLWVRETFCDADELYDGVKRVPANVFGYRADLSARSFDGRAIDTTNWNWEHRCVKWKPSIHMPRGASRIQLEIVKVSVERLQEITEEDAMHEGVKPVEEDGNVYHDYMILKEGPYRLAFAILWDELIFKRGYGWEKNPFVWVVEFRRIK